MRAFVRHRLLTTSLRSWYATNLLARLPRDLREERIRFLDVGTGTGQFASEITSAAKKQGLRVHVTVLEPSPAFRSYLTCTRSARRYQINNERLEEFYPGIPFHLILLSEVAHLFHDLPGIFMHLARMLVPGGIVGLRYSSRQQVLDRNWYDFFPVARNIDVSRAPCAEEYENLLITQGFDCSTEAVDDSYGLDERKRFEIVANRAYSSFCLVPEREFESGLKQLAAAISLGRVDHRWHNPMTWTTARIQSHV